MHIRCFKWLRAPTDHNDANSATFVGNLKVYRIHVSQSLKLTSRLTRYSPVVYSDQQVIHGYGKIIYTVYYRSVLRTRVDKHK